VSLAPAAASRAVVGLLVAGSLLAAPAIVLADRLYLDGGGVIETASWRIEGESLVYDSPTGTIGIPRSMVLKIEKTETPTGRDAQGASVPTVLAEQPVAGTKISGELATLLTEAKAALARRDFLEAADRYRAALDRADTDFQIPRIGYALSQIALGEDDLALGVVLDGLARDPREPSLLELLGDLRNREERVTDALRAWRAAFDRSPSDRLRQKIEKAEREQHVGRDYELSTTSHFNLRYDGHVDDELTAGVRRHLEEQFWIQADALRHTPRQPITVLLYPKRKFRDVTQSPEWVGGLYDGKIRVPLGGLKRLNPVAAGVLNHELAHAIIHSKTRGNCPRWLHEGLAQRFEGKASSRVDAERVAAQLAAGDAATWEDRGFSYPMALSLSRYLEARSGFHRVVDLLEELGRGASTDEAMQRVYGVDYAAICRGWKESVFEELEE
jgi:hypothetical protein